MNFQLCHDAGGDMWPMKQLRVRLPAGRSWQIKARGLVFVLLTLITASAALHTGNNLVFLVLAALLSTLLISNLISRLSLAGLEFDFRLPEHISARRTIGAQLIVRNCKRWMPSFSAYVTGAGESVFAQPVYFPLLPGGATAEETVQVSFTRRGLHREPGFEVSTCFPFGFLEHRTPVPMRREILVYPCLDPQPGFEEFLSAIEGEIETYYHGRGHDFYRIRPYEAFESARHVDWKATARTGTLQVREFAKEQDPLIEIFVDLNVPEQSRPWFERAVECCAFITWSLAAKEMQLHFRSQNFQITVPATGDVYTILKYLALVEPRPGSLPVEPGAENSFQIVFTAQPEKITQSGWSPTRVVAPSNLPENFTTSPS